MRWQLIACLLAGVPQSSAQSVDYRITTDSPTGSGSIDTFSLYFHTYSVATVVGTITNPGDGAVIEDTADFPEIDDFAYASLVYTGTNNDAWNVLTLELKLGGVWKTMTAPDASHQSGGHVVIHSGHVDAEFFDMNDDKTPVNTIATKFTTSNVAWAETSNIIVIFFHSETDVHYAGVIYDSPKEKVWDIVAKDCPFPLADLVSVTAKAIRADNDGYHLAKVELQQADGTFTSLYGQNWQGTSGWINHVQASWMPVPVDSVVLTLHKVLLRIATYTDADSGSADTFSIYMNSYNDSVVVATKTSPAVGEVAYFNFEFDRFFDIAYVSLVYAGTNNDDWRVSHVEVFMYGRWENFTCPDALEERKAGRPEVSTINAAHLDSEWFDLTGTKPTVNSITTKWTTDDVQFSGSSNIITIFFHSETEVHYAGVIYDAELGSEWDITATDCPFPVSQLLMVTARALRAANDGYIVKTVELSENGGFTLLWGLTFNGYGGWINHVQPGWAQNPMDEAVFGRTNGMLRITTGSDPAAGSDDDFSIYMHSYHEAGLVATKSSSSPGEVAIVPFNYDGMDKLALVSLVYNGTANDDWQVAAVDLYTVAGWVSLSAPDVPAGGVAHIEVGHIDSEWFDMRPRSSVNTITTKWFTSTAASSESDNLFIIFYHSDLEVHYAGSVADPTRGQEVPVTATDCPFPLSELRMVTVRALRSEASDGWILEKVELEQADGSFSTMYGQTWESSGGWVNHQQPSWMPDPLDEVVLTPKKVLLRITTNGAADSGSADSFAVYIHSYHEAIRAATIAAPASGDATLVNVDYNPEIFSLSYFSLIYEGTNDDEWQVKSVEYYKKGGWKHLTCPDAKATGDLALINAAHIDSEWFDMHPKVATNTVKTLWITASESFAETTNIVVIYYHSATQTHYAGVIYDPTRGSIWVIEAVDCPFPVEDLRMVTANALRDHTSDGYIVERVEIMIGGRYQKMWGQPWNAYGGWITHTKPGWMTDPSDEIVLTTNVNPVLLRIKTYGDDAAAGSNDKFSVYLHSYHTSMLVGTIESPVVGQVLLLDFDFADSVADLAHISLVYNGTSDDDWWVKEVELYIDGDWRALTSPDLKESVDAGGVNASVITAAHADSEWFDFSAKPTVNTITTKWTTSTADWSETSNIIAIYFHSETMAHYAGAIYDAERGDEWVITATDCPFSLGDLRMVTARALRASNDGYVVAKVELMQQDGSYALLYSPTWQGTGGWISHVQAGWMPDPLDEVVFTLKDTDLLVRITTASEEGSGSNDSFSMYMHTYHESTLVATKDSPAVGEVSIFSIDFPAFDQLAHTSLVYAGAKNDDWRVASVELYINKAWRPQFSPDAVNGPEPIHEGHLDSEWFDISEKPTVNTITTIWNTADEDWAETTNIIAIYFHSSTQVHYAGAIYDPKRDDSWNITATDCPFPLADLRMVTARALRASNDGYIVGSVELLQADGTYLKLWGVNWQAYGGWISHVQAGWMPDRLDEVVLTMSKVLMRITTDSSADAGSTEKFSVYMHSYHESALVATVEAPSAGEVVLLDLDFAELDEIAHISLVYNDTTVNDDWWVSLVQIYTKDGWKNYSCPDAIEAAEAGQLAVSIITPDHIDSEWLDFGERKQVNTITTKWTTSTDLWSETTNIIAIYFHSHDKVHYADAIYDPKQGSEWTIEATDCPFPVDQLLMVTARALRGSDDGYIVEKVELLENGVYTKMWGQSWQAYGGWITHVQKDWMPDPLHECVLTRKNALMRITTSSDAAAGSTDRFSVYMHTYHESTLVATVASPSAGSVMTLNVDFPDSVNELAHISLVYSGTLNDDWQVSSVEAYMDGTWQTFSCPDAIEAGKAGLPEVSIITADHIDSEWFDMGERLQVNTIATKWTTDTVDWSETTNIITIFYHSDTQVHYAGVIYDPQKGDVFDINPTNCPFPVGDLRMVTARALRASNDGYIVKQVELLQEDGTYLKLWGVNWQAYGGWISHVQAGWMPDRLDEIVLTKSKVLMRITTDSSADAGSTATFSVYMHSYHESALVATVESPSAGEVVLLDLDFAELEGIAHISLVYNDSTVNDDWWVSLVQVYMKDGWKNYSCPDAIEAAEAGQLAVSIITPDHIDSEWLDFGERKQVNTITTKWTTSTDLWSETTNIIAIYFHSHDQVHYADAIYDPKQGSVWTIEATDCPFPVDQLLMVSARALRGSDDGYIVEKVELLENGVYTIMWGQTWQAYGGWITHVQKDWMPDPLHECVLTRKKALLRVITSSDAAAGSTDSFSVYMHTYHESTMVATVDRPAVGSIIGLNVDFSDMVNELAHVSLVYSGTNNDDWQVSSVEVYMDGNWEKLSCPDAIEAGEAGLPEVSIITADHIDSEWFDMGERLQVNTIETKWTTDTVEWSETTNIITIFYHSERQVHYAGVIYDPKRGDVFNIVSTNCPFPVGDLRMVTARALRASNDGYIVKQVELKQEDETFAMLWGQTWQAYGGWISHVQAGWMPDRLDEVVLTLKRALLRITTADDAAAGSTDAFSVYIHSYHENVLATTITAPGAGQTLIVDVDYDFGTPSYFSLVYSGSNDDEWQVVSVEYYKTGGWHQLTSPDAEESADGIARITASHIDSEWFDLHPKPAQNTIKTLWVTASETFAETTNIIVVYFHSETQTHYAGVIYDPSRGSVWHIEAVDCPFPLSELRMVTANALREHTSDGYIVEKVEVMTGTGYQKMWGQPWNAYGGWIIHTAPGWMTIPSDEIVLTTNVNPVLLRIKTYSGNAAAGSTDKFSVYLHSYHTSMLVGTIESPAEGQVSLLNYDFPDAIADLAHVSLVYNGTSDDDWWVKEVELYIDGDWRALTSPDLKESVDAGGVNASVITAAHADSEWFDFSAKPTVNTITTKWTTSTDDWSETTNIIAIYFHSETMAHYAGAIYDAERGDEWVISATDCPFSLGDLRMVTARALRASNDGYVVAKVELMQQDGSYALLYSPTWQGTGGWISHVQAGWMPDPLDEVVFTLKDTDLLVRITTASEEGSGSNDSFSMYMHTYHESTLVATKDSPAVGEVSIFSIDFPAFDQLAHTSLVYAGAKNDDWRVASVELYINKAWRPQFSPDAVNGPEPIHEGHLDSEWFDVSEKPTVNTITTIWNTADEDWAETTNIIAIYFHSSTQVHYAGAIYDPKRDESLTITATDCPFPLADLRMVTARALRASNDGYIVESVELLQADGTYLKLWGVNWQAYGGWISHVQAGWMPDRLDEVVLTMSKVLMRITTDSSADAGSTAKFSVYMHSYHESALVATVEAPSAGEVVLLDLDFAELDEIAHISLVYNDTTVNDDWWVSLVQIYTKDGWKNYSCPDAIEAAEAGQLAVSIITPDHIDSEWLDFGERKQVNTITTKWTTSTDLWSETTNIIAIYFHSHDKVHYADAIYDPKQGSEWTIEATDCPFPVDQLLMVTARALRGSDDGYIVEKVELLENGVYTKMWGQSWQAYGGWITHVQKDWMPDPLHECVLTRKNALMRITTSSDAAAGSTDRFSVYMHTYHESTLVTTVTSPSAGSVMTLNVDFPDSVNELAHISLVYSGTLNDDWQVSSVEAYMDGTWQTFSCPDAIEAGKAGLPEVSIITADHIDSEWFDMGERLQVNTIATKWTTDTVDWSETTNIITIFYHSDTQVHYAGVIYDPQKGDVFDINPTNCPFPVGDLRMVTARALRASNDGYIVKQVELLQEDGTYLKLWGVNWQAYGGWISHVQAGWMPDRLDEVVLTKSKVLMRITTDSSADAGSTATFSVYMHSYHESALVATVESPSAGEVVLLDLDFAELEGIAHISLVYNDSTVNDDWWVSLVQVYTKDGWKSYACPDAIEAGEAGQLAVSIITPDHIDSEWLDFGERKQVNTITTKWTTSTDLWSETTNIIAIYFHSHDQVHYADAIYDPKQGSVWTIEATDCPFPVDQLLMVTARALRGSDDGYIVEKVELLENGVYTKMWGQTWQAYGGWITHVQKDWMPDPLHECVLTRKNALLRIITSSDAAAGSTDRFSVYMHTYHESTLVTTVTSPSAGSVMTLNVDFPDSVNELAHISLVYSGTLNDDWQVSSVEAYMDGTWQTFSCPDAIEAGEAGLPEVSIITADHIDSEWFDMGERLQVNTIATKWTTDTVDWSETTNIITIFYHSDTQVHYAGVIYDPQKGDVFDINPTNCPFPVGDLRMVTARALRASNDGYIVKQVELLQEDGTYLKLWGVNWQAYGGWISHVQAGWMPDRLDEVVLTKSKVLMRITTDSSADAGSTATFSVYLHSYHESALVATVESPSAGEVVLLDLDFAELEGIAHISLVYNDSTVNDDWWVSLVQNLLCRSSHPTTSTRSGLTSAKGSR
ncbi:hypothetical protein DIPPA_34692 [Diplonema papillatum]|nr:hypothetical protein DIPPA_34692 [Diplonema papillatum]